LAKEDIPMKTIQIGAKAS
jgi:hypothetical protein